MTSTTMIKSAAFNAGIEDGIRQAAMSKEAIIGLSALGAGARGLAARAAPFVAQHVNPMVSAAHAGAPAGMGGAVAGAAGSAINSIGQVMRARGGARVVNLAKDGAGATRMRNPLLHRLGGAVSAGGGVVGALG